MMTINLLSFPRKANTLCHAIGKKILILAFFFSSFTSAFSQCPDWNICGILEESDGCTSTFLLNIEGDEDFLNFEIDILRFEFIVSDQAEILVAEFVDPNSPMALAPVVPTISTNSNIVRFNFSNLDNPLTGERISGDQIRITVAANGECFTFDRWDINRIINFDDFAFCDATGTCDPIEDCPTGTLIDGLVTGYSNETTPCPTNPGLGIEGAEVTITSPGGQCVTETESDGSYECDLCGDGPFEICVTEICEEPCGLTDLDLTILARMILGIDEPEFIDHLIGDVDGSGSVTAFDMLTVRKWLLGHPIEPPIENWCRFISVEDLNSQIVLDTPISDQLDNCVQLEDSNAGSTDFIRLMLGDMNGSCDDCDHGFAPDQAEVDAKLAVDQHLNPIELNEKIFAFTLNGTIENVQDVDHIATPLLDAEYTIDENGKLHFIWFDLSENQEGIMLEKDQPFIEVITKKGGVQKIKLSTEDSYVLTENSIYSLQSNLQINQNSLAPQGIDNLSTLQLNGDQPATALVYDLQGRLLINKIVNPSTLIRSELQVPNDGIYIVKIFNAENNFADKLFLLAN